MRGIMREVRPSVTQWQNSVSSRRLLLLAVLLVFPMWLTNTPALVGESLTDLCTPQASPSSTVRADPNRPVYPWSDTVTGVITDFDRNHDLVTLRTIDGHLFQPKLTRECAIYPLANLGEKRPKGARPAHLFIATGTLVMVFGTFYPEGEITEFEAQKIFLLGDCENGYRFEEPHWWVRQIRQLANSYLAWQFPGGRIDYERYATNLTFEGQPGKTRRQEAATISRLIYGLATAFLLTGEPRFLEAAEKGCRYLQAHFRHQDKVSNGIYWDHARVWEKDHWERQLASLFPDDEGAIPLYEQIYVLAGLTQTYRITGDPALLADIRGTQRFFEARFRDMVQGGYYSHVDSKTFSAEDRSLGKNRWRKNWNSIGDHAPAYLINLFLALEDPTDGERLRELGGLITPHFPGRDGSPFVQERFHGDWEPDRTWSWQRDRGVIGHNLKIIWNLLRIQTRFPHPDIQALAKNIADAMPHYGLDRQRGGWYDVVERRKDESRMFHSFVWHDRKVWWQQEQGILAYALQHGLSGDATALDLARFTAAFYNLCFLDSQDGGVYFHVTAQGIPYAQGDERQKGSHAMSGYHAFELCYLATAYTQLLCRNGSMDLHFRPVPGAFDGTLRVAPDLLPPGRVHLKALWVDGKPLAMDQTASLSLDLRRPGLQPARPIKVRLSGSPPPIMP